MKSNDMKRDSSKDCGSNFMSVCAISYLILKKKKEKLTRYTTPHFRVIFYIINSTQKLEFNPIFRQSMIIINYNKERNVHTTN